MAFSFTAQEAFTGQKTVPVGVAIRETFTATAAEINDGKVLLQAIPGFQYKVTDASFIANGTVTELTALVVEDTDGNDIISVAQASLSDDAVVFAADETVSGTKFNVFLGSNVGVQVVKTGSDEETATDVAITLEYVVSSPVGIDLN